MGRPKVDDQPPHSAIPPLVPGSMQLSSLSRELEACKEFGFDLEAHNARTFHGLTCLLQVSTSDKDYVVDPLAKEMWESMSILREVFANPDILKVGIFFPLSFAVGVGHLTVTATGDDGEGYLWHNCQAFLDVWGNCRFSARFFRCWCPE